MATRRDHQQPAVRALPSCSGHPRPGAWPEAFAERPDARYAALQRRMADVHAAEHAKRPGRTMVVVPSRTVEKWHADPAEHRAYEERLLCLLLGLRDPGLRIVYVTSSPLEPAVVAYYLSLLPDGVRRDARRRLTLVGARDASPRPLAEKLLEQPRLLTRIRWALGDRALCHLAPYTSTTRERDLALELDIPMYAADPRHAHLGTKSGARRLFAQAGAPHPLGVEGVTSAAGVVAAIARLRAVKPDLAEVVVKLDEGVSGEGNAIVDVRGLPAPGAAYEAQLIAQRVDAMALEADGVTLAAYLAKLAHGGIVEERIRGEALHSPSVQLELTPAGEVEVVSTHDQLLGGPTGQSYVGCRFPAAPAYAREITDVAGRVGGHLAHSGVIGRCAIDFVVVCDGAGPSRPYAIELNLRKGGTTHPCATLQLAAGGSYDAHAARFLAADGRQRHYVATDHLESSELRALSEGELLGLAGRRRDLAFDRARGYGVVLHMVSALALGRLGLTAIGRSDADARRRYERACAAVLEVAAASAPPAAA